MFHSRWYVLTLLISFSALAEVSHVEKMVRLKQLESLKASYPAINLEAYQRELKYDAQELPLEERAKLESNRLAEKIKTQVNIMYQAALDRLEDPEAAAQEIKDSIERDIVLVASNLQEEILKLALDSLAEAQKGAFSSEVSLEQVEVKMLDVVTERSTSLDQMMDANVPSGSDSPDANKFDYKTKADLLRAMTSQREGTRWIETGGFELESRDERRSQGKISFQFKTSFLGAEIEAGPTILVRKEVSTTLAIIGEGQYPITKKDGTFDFFKRDFNGKVLSGTRFIAFTCSATLYFETDSSVGANFHLVGLGGGATRGRQISDNVTLEQRRLHVPKFVERKQVTFQFMKKLCHLDYMNAKISSTMTVRQAADLQLKHQLAGYAFSHPKTKCVVDRQCVNWFKKEHINLVGGKAYPRCVENKREKFRACVLGSLVNQKCPVFANGKKVSKGGLGENPCDRGLRCVTTKPAGKLFWQWAEASCKPVNAKTYKSPARIK